MLGLQWHNLSHHVTAAVRTMNAYSPLSLECTGFVAKALSLDYMHA